MALVPGDQYFLISDAEKAFLTEYCPEIAALFSEQVDYNGNTWACPFNAFDIWAYDYDADYIFENVSFETAQYYKSGIFFDTP